MKAQIIYSDAFDRRARDGRPGRLTTREAQIARDAYLEGIERSQRLCRFVGPVRWQPARVSEQSKLLVRQISSPPRPTLAGRIYAIITSAAAAAVMVFVFHL